MRKFLILCVTVFVAFSCANKNSAVISAQIDGADSKDILISQLDVNHIRVLDTDAEAAQSKGPKRDGVHKITGRQGIDEYFENYAKRTHNDHVELVVVAAMFYASFLENPNEAPNLKHKYRVIAMAKDELDKLKKELGIRGVKTRVVRARDDQYLEAKRQGYGEE